MDSQDTAFDIVVDVLVVGFGAAGAVAALQAHEQGADVMLIDRFQGGGTTAKSGGVVYAGATRFQAEAGFSDDVDNMRRYLETEVGEAVRPETLKRFCEGSAADLDWLIANGIAFSSEAHVEKASFPPEGKYLYYSGNEKAAANAAIARPVPRGHRPVGPGFGGTHLHRGLEQRIAETPIDVRRHCGLRRLITDADGRVVGAGLAVLDAQHHAEHARLYEQSNPIVPKADAVHLAALKRIEALENAHSAPLLVKVRTGVILATGGYAFNNELFREFTPRIVDYKAKFHRLATLGNDGFGLTLARGLGAATRQMNALYVARHIVPGALTQGVLVNAAGERFIAEDSYISLIGDAISRQTDGVAWLIVNAVTLRTALKQVFGSGWLLFRYFAVRLLPNLVFGGTRRAGNLKTLARKIGIPHLALAESARRHDASIAGGEADALGKSYEGRAPLARGPFYAINMNFSNPRAVTLLMTLGGLEVDQDDGSVLREEGSKIGGLFACGNCAVGLHSNGYISGLALADCVFAGRRAGRAAATRQALC